jgi:hypothetical protein
MGEDFEESLIWACSPWLVRRVLGRCVATKNKSVRLEGQSGQFLLVGWGVTWSLVFQYGAYNGRQTHIQLDLVQYQAYRRWVW